MEHIFDLIKAECERQEKKWGKQYHPDAVWHLILSEEVGEVAKAILEDNQDEIRAELIQCAAVVVSWLMDDSSGSLEHHHTESHYTHLVQ